MKINAIVTRLLFVLHFVCINQFYFCSWTLITFSFAISPPLLINQMIGPMGMEKFCEDIGVEPENVVMLAIAWHLEAQTMGFFTLAEWLKGMTKLQCDSVQKLVNSLDLLRDCFADPNTFKR